MRRARVTIIVALLFAGLFAAIGTALSNWTGFGFNPGGPEMSRLREVLALTPGMSVADVGTGKGQLTLALAREVGPAGRVFATDIDAERVAALRAAVKKDNLRNVFPVQAQPRETGLPSACCDAIVLRRVYHHLTDPAETNLGLRDALRPGGTLLVIDFPPPLAWLWPWSPEGVPSNRGGHGIASKLVIDEVTASGLELKEVVKDWPGPWLLKTYGLVFRKPL
jgi:ubiquinone/menaquinone biosynthesis C-methylase UbiE